MKNPFHKHVWKLKERSNIIQYDNMGYVLRLFIVKCSCGKTEQIWIDSTECKSDCVCKWFEEDTSIPVPPKTTWMIKLQKIGGKKHGIKRYY